MMYERFFQWFRNESEEEKNAKALIERVFDSDKPWESRHLDKLIHSKAFSYREKKRLQKLLDDKVRRTHKDIANNEMCKILIGEGDIAAIAETVDTLREYQEKVKISQAAGQIASSNSNLLAQMQQQYAKQQALQNYTNAAQQYVPQPTELEIWKKLCEDEQTDVTKNHRYKLASRIPRPI